MRLHLHFVTALYIIIYNKQSFTEYNYKKGGKSILKTYGKLNKEVLGERQQMIMQCIWDAGESVTIQEITTRMKEKFGIEFSKASINTLVLMLVDRGYLTQGKKIHQAFTFKAVISKQEYRAKEIKRINESVFDGSQSALLASMLQCKDIEKAEIAKMKSLIEMYDGDD